MRFEIRWELDATTWETKESWSADWDAVVVEAVVEAVVEVMVVVVVEDEAELAVLK